MGQWVFICGKFKIIVDEDNSSFKKRLVANKRPEAEWSNHEQIEGFVETHAGGSNSFLLKKIGMICD